MTHKAKLLGAAAISALTLAVLAPASPVFAQNATNPASPTAQSTSTPSGAMDSNGAAQNGNMNTQGTTAPSSPAMGSSASGAATQGVPLARVDNPQTTLASAKLQDSMGQAIGQVQDVKTGSSGKPTSVVVALNTSTGQSKLVKIKASRLRYDSTSNTLTTKLSQSELESLPSAETSNSSSTGAAPTSSSGGSTY